MYIEHEKVLFRKERIKAEPRAPQFNLLKIHFLKKPLLWKGFPYSIQLLILFFLAGLIALGWGLHAPEGSDAELFANLNLVCLIVWGIWWPVMIWTVVLFGRLWCMICPLELVNRIGERAGRFLGVRQLKKNGPVKSGVVIVVLYAFIQLLVSGTDLDEVPAYTAYFLSGLITFALLTGLVFKKSMFCKSFCPVSLMLNTYGRGSMLAVRAGSEAGCANCKDKSCVKRAGKSIFDSKSCPVNIFPPEVKSNKDCILCGQCIKSCSYGNIKLLLRLPFDRRDKREKKASRVVTAFIMIDSGFVTRELAEEWPAADKIFMFIPQVFTDFFHLPSFAGWIEGVWVLFVFPVLLWTLFSTVMKLRRTPLRITDIWRDYALRAVIIFSSAHMIKSLIKFNESVSFLPIAISDPAGMNNIKAFGSGILQMPQPAIGYIAVSMISSLVLGFALYFSIRENSIVKAGTNI